MKKLYILLFLMSFASYAQKNVTITKIIETGCSSPFVKSVELYVDGTVDFSNEVTLNYMNNGDLWSANQIDVSGFGIISDKFIYIIRDLTLMQAEFPSTTFETNSTSADFNTIIVGTSTNGDDGYQLVLNGNVVSQFGKTETDADNDTDSNWNHSDAVATRLSNPDLGTWNPTDWVITAENDLDDNTACQGVGTNLETYFNTLGGNYPLGSGSGWTLSSLELKGIIVFESGGTQGKAIHLVANKAISDLSDYGLGTAGNGGGTDGLEYTFPAQAVAAGSHIFVPRNTIWMTDYFVNLDVFDIVIEASVANQNGDDAIELFGSVNTTPVVIETFGDIDCRPSSDGTTTTCPSFQFHGNSWAYKESGIWTYGGIDCTGTGTVNTLTSQASSCPYPFADSKLSSNEFTISELSIYPNPVKNGLINIKSPLSGVKKVEIFDVTGRSVLKTELETDALDIRSIGAGLYLLKVSIGDRSSTEKIIIK